MLNKKLIVIIFIAVVVLIIIIILLFNFFSRPAIVVQESPIANRIINNVPSKTGDLLNKDQMIQTVDVANPQKLNNPNKIIGKNGNITIIDTFPSHLMIFIDGGPVGQNLLKTLAELDLKNKVYYQVREIDKSSTDLSLAKNVLANCKSSRPIIDSTPFLYEGLDEKCYFGTQAILDKIKMQAGQNSINF